MQPQASAKSAPWPLVQPGHPTPASPASCGCVAPPAFLPASGRLSLQLPPHSAPDVAPTRFCFPCISRWAEVENSCPFCKTRFSWLRRKRLAGRAALLAADPNAPLPGQYLESKAVEERNQVWSGHVWDARVCALAFWKGVHRGWGGVGKGGAQGWGEERNQVCWRWI